MITKKVSGNLIKLSTHRKNNNFKKALSGYKKILKEDPELIKDLSIYIQIYCRDSPKKA